MAQFKAWLAARGFTGPLWVTEHGYAADPAYQSDPAYRDGEASQGAYLTQTLLGLGEAGAPQVFVTLHDGSLDGEYATEGLEHIDETPGGGYPVARRPAFAAVRRVVDDWDQLIAWRAQQRDQEQEQRVEQGKTRDCRGRSARGARQGALCDSQRPRDAGRPRRREPCQPNAPGAGPLGPPARPRASAPRGGAHRLLWKSAVARWHSHRADDHAAAVLLLKTAIAG